MKPSRTSPVRRTCRRAVVTALALVTAGLLASCGLRLETPPHPALVPDAVELVRQRTVADAQALGSLAGQAAVTSPDPAVQQVLTLVADTSDQHLDALGGVYDDGRPDPSGAPGATSGATAPPPVPAGTEAAGAASETPPAAGSVPTDAPVPTPEEITALLVETAASARADAAAVEDGRLARLLGSVAVSRQLLAEALTSVAGLDVALVTSGMPFDVPDVLPAGVGTTDLAVLVQSEDALGLAWEVVAARSAQDARQQAAARAVTHRDRAQDWARAAGVDATDQDPRRSTYDLPPAITSATVDAAAMSAELATLEGRLLEDYTTLIALAAPGERSALVDAALDSARQQALLTGALAPFPGLPERP